MGKSEILHEDYKQVLSREYPWSRLKDKTVLITGGGGFLAGHLIRTLIYISEQCDFSLKIITTSRDIIQTAEKYRVEKTLFPHLSFIEWDLLSNQKFDCDVNFVLHTASAASPTVFNADPTSAILPNTVGTINLFSSLQSCQIENFLFMSTSGVYGFMPDNDRPNKENVFGSLDPALPESVYLESKRMGETISFAWGKKFRKPVTTVRPSISYGPGINFNDGRSFADFIEALVLNRNIVLESDGMAYRNFCYVSDVVAGIILVLLSGENGEAYNLATETEIKIKDLAFKLTNEVFPEKKLSVVFNQDRPRTRRVEFSRTQVDCKKIRDLGWSEMVGLTKGFKRTVESYSVG